MGLDFEDEYADSALSEIHQALAHPYPEIVVGTVGKGVCVKEKSLYAINTNGRVGRYFDRSRPSSNLSKEDKDGKQLAARDGLGSTRKRCRYTPHWLTLSILCNGTY